MSLAKTLSGLAPNYNVLSSPTTVIKTPKAPKAPAKTPAKTPKTTLQQIDQNPFGVFTQADPYAPGKIGALAQSGYDADAALAKTNSQLGYLTPAQIDAQAQNRVTQENALASSLADRLGQIQQASVGQGNAAGAALGSQDSASQQAANRVIGAAGGVAAPTAPPAGLGAVLGSQTSAEGNLYGGLEAAAIQGGGVFGQKALDAAQTQKTTDQADQAKTLAQLLSGIATPSARSATMINANTGVESANKATELSIWTGLENRRATAAVEGDKKAEAAATLAERKYEAGLSSQDRRAIADETATTSTNNNIRTTNTTAADAALVAKTKKDVATINANARAAGKVHGLTPSQALAAAKAVVAIRTQKSGTKVTSPSQYSVTLRDPNPLATQPKPLLISPADYASGAWKKQVPKGLTVQGTPLPSKTTPSTINAQSEWTKYKEALGTMMNSYGLARTDAVHYLGSLGWKAPKSGGK